MILVSVCAFSCTLFSAETGSTYDSGGSDYYNDYDNVNYQDIYSIPDYHTGCTGNWDACRHLAESVRFGFTEVNNGGKCYEIRGFSLDSALKAGQAFGIIATIFGVFAAIAVILTTFIIFPKKAFMGMSVASFFVAFCASLVVSVGFATDFCKNSVKCTPGPAWYAGFFGMLCWIGAGVSLLFMKKRERDDIGQEGDVPATAEVLKARPGSSEEPTIAVKARPGSLEEVTTVNETIVENPDGSKTKTTITTSVKDGTKVIEKLTETV